MAKPVYSFVIPVYNEEETLPILHDRLIALLDRLDGDAEVILIDDGSRDASYPIMLALNEKDPRIKVVQLSRNFGHQTAITVGMDFSTGDATIIMDADLQDPPEVVIEMAMRWREGCEVVYGVREERAGEAFLKRFTASLFYRILRRLTDLDIPVDVGDFRLVDRRALDAFKRLREHGRYVRGMFTWIGFKQCPVTYSRPERLAGKTKYPFTKMLRLAMDGILSFSAIPLRIGLYAGLLVAGVSFVVGIWAIILKVSGAYAVPGWASLLTAVAFLGGVQLILVGLLGEYVSRIADEVRARPLYIIRDSRGFADEEPHR